MHKQLMLDAARGALAAITYTGEYLCTVIVELEKDSPDLQQLGASLSQVGLGTTMQTGALDTLGGLILAHMQALNAANEPPASAPRQLRVVD
jgi:hypothetical protein